MANPVTHFEVAVQDVKKMKGFYSKAFGWKFGKGPHKGVHFTEAGSKPGIPGFLIERGGHIPDYVSLYIEVDSIDKAVRIFKNNGGDVIREPFSPDGINKVCIVSDPEGHLFSLSELSRKRAARGAKTKQATSRKG